MDKKKIDSLTGLRFYMMFVIVMSHMSLLENMGSEWLYNQYFHNNGFFPVDFFFMISGFGLAYNYRGCENITLFSSIKYAVNRVKKLYPLYFVTGLLFVPCMIWVELELGGFSFINVVVKNIIKLLMYLGLIQSATGVGAFAKGYNSVGWFLSTLFIIYILTPALLKLNEKIRGKAKWITIMLFGNIVLYVFVYYAFEMVENYTFFDSLCYESPYIRIFIFVIGILLADLREVLEKSIKNMSSVYEYTVTVLYFLWFFVVRPMIMINVIYKRAVDIFLCIILILVISMERGKVAEFLRRPINIKLGSITMYIFLIHYPLCIYAKKFLKWFNVKENILIGWAGVVLIWTVTVLLSFVLMHRKIRRDAKNPAVAKNVEKCGK